MFRALHKKNLLRMKLSGLKITRGLLSAMHVVDIRDVNVLLNKRAALCSASCLALPVPSREDCFRCTDTVATANKSTACLGFPYRKAFSILTGTCIDAETFYVSILKKWLKSRMPCSVKRSFILFAKLDCLHSLSDDHNL